MQETMQYIDDFFTGLLSKEEVKTFEERIKNDPVFAADVAFYISSRQAAKEMTNDEKKTRFREIYKPGNGYHHQEQPAKVVSMRKVMRIALAAAIITAVVTTFVLNSKPSTSELASKYINKEYPQLSVQMGTADDLSKAAQSYNDGKYAEAEAAFESVMTKDTASYSAVQYAGVSAMRAGNYDKALQHFRTMEKFHTHYNPAVLLQAVALMKRNQPGDKHEAQSLLHRVVDNNLDGKETAQEWLK